MDDRAIVRHVPHMQPSAELDPLQVSEILARSGYFKDSRDAAQAAVKVLLGRELGFGPVTSMMGIHIIEGKPSLSANLMAALVKRSGRYDYRVRRSDPQGAEIEFFEQGESLGVSSFTSQDAHAAGLGNRGPWKSYPKAMMFSRAMSQGVRMFCPDLMGGAPAYTPEELGAEVNAETGEMLAVSTDPPRPRTQEEVQQRVRGVLESIPTPAAPLITGGPPANDAIRRSTLRLQAVCSEAGIDASDVEWLRAIIAVALDKDATVKELDAADRGQLAEFINEHPGACKDLRPQGEEQQAETLPLELEAAGVPAGLAQ